MLRTLLPKGRFARGAAVLVSGTAAGQSVVILSSPVLTRLYTPEEFGTLAVYSAALATIVLVASGRYELAIPLARAGGAAANLMALSLLVLLATTLLTTLGVSVFGEHLIALTNTPALGPFVWILPLGVLLGGANKVFTYWALRKEAFRRIASTRFQHGTGMV
ncbi:MAG: lipopolysaccharide biosynthesis protein, partial [Longimicrobiales bacterium]